MKREAEVVKGIVSRIIYSSDNFSVFSVDSSGKKLNVTGKFLVNEGDDLILTGSYSIHPKYGRQFVVEEFEFNSDIDKEGLISYISKNKNIVGIGPVKAKKLVDWYFDGFELNLSNKISEMATNIGVPESSLEILKEDWLKKKQYSVVYSKLSKIGFSFNTINKLLEKYGNNTINILKTNPYQLIGQIQGFAFKKIDDLALKLKIDPKLPQRIEEGIKWVVNNNEDEGHSWIERKELVQETNTLLHIDSLDSKDLIKNSLSDLLLGKMLFSLDERISNPRTYQYELDIYNKLKTKAENHLIRDFSTNIFNHAPYSQLNEKQKSALNLFSESSMLLIAGVAGSGKTHVVNCIVKIIEENGIDYLLLGPTGKAAKRIQETTGRNAATIHRLLKYKGGEYYDYVEGQIQNKVVIVDEFSMVTIDLLWNLFRACKNCVFVFCGDHQQLPPVGLGNILRDILQRNLINVVVFNECMRQSGELKENCLAVLNGEVRDTSKNFIGLTERRCWYKINKFKETKEVLDFLKELYSKYIPLKLEYDLIKDIQLLSPTNKGPLGTEELNKYLQEIVQDVYYKVKVSGKKWYKGDRVLQCRNNYDLSVMNGEIGIIEHVGKNILKINIDTRSVDYEEEDIKDLKLAYCTTVHKYQGAEIPFAIFICHKSHAYQHSRNLFYTGVTRGKQSTMIIGDSWGISNCVKKQMVDSRRTFLSVI